MVYGPNLTVHPVPEDGFGIPKIHSHSDEGDLIMVMMMMITRIVTLYYGTVC